MKTNFGKFFTKVLALLLIITLMPSGLGLATSDSRPETAVPFEGKSTSDESLLSSFFVDKVLAFPGGLVFQNGGDRLASLQNNDGGWDWPLSDGNHV